MVWFWFLLTAKDAKGAKDEKGESSEGGLRKTVFNREKRERTRNIKPERTG
jgi:hypothetical protein